MKQAHPPARGVTLIEMVIAIAVLVLLATLALPAFQARLDRQRLAAAAEALATDLAEARFEAVRRGQAAYVEPAEQGGAWCWAVSTQSGCTCDQAQPCQLRAVQSSSYKGIKLIEPHAVRLDPDGTAETQASAVFESRHGERLRVDLQALGRVRICTLAGSDTRYPHC
ncbi:Pilus assembly protein FimT [Rubrivivax sp. A210]|uniref:GspH/FimT family pseudopilin n=1 Tax=Rubrivivax sp. A210 TaxID=2772301 RepID=UPI0019194FB8|nr:GspH/FimT family protein [Rubrivivax sp. A210]CAD5373625.1 Pilus assembly protein FimT [Rubrivivax sp. A210]